MAPSAALQSRIKAFEDLQANANGTTKLSGGMRPVTTRFTVPLLNDLLDSEPTSPSSDPLRSITPLQPVQIDSRASSPAILGRKSSLIHFSELASPLLKPVSSVTTNGTGSTSSSSLSDTLPKPQLPPRSSPSKVPPLPPRKPSISSLKTASASSTPPPLPKRSGSSTFPTLRNNSGPKLLSPNSHTYPPAGPGSSSQGFTRHAPTSSTSSFHSVSLSSDGGETLDDSLDGSYEAVSSTVATSPLSDSSDLPFTSSQWPLQKQGSPRASLTPASNDTLRVSIIRRAPPPPPQRRAQDAGSLQHTSLQPPLRPIIMPQNVRKRYDDLFERNLRHQLSQSRSAVGWRGPSLDLWTTDQSHMSGGSHVEERLNGAVIKCIWNCSKLSRERLREIWNECDPNGMGSLDKDSFARGMWRIDEILRIAQEVRRKKSPPPPPAEHIPVTYTPRSIPPSSQKPPILRQL